jgi:hypothetical protein
MEGEMRMMMMEEGEVLVEEGEMMVVMTNPSSV